MVDKRILLICIDGDCTYHAMKSRGIGRFVNFGAMVHGILNLREFQSYAKTQSVHVVYLTSDVTYLDNPQGSEDRRVRHQAFLQSLDYQYKGIEVVKFPIFIKEDSPISKNTMVETAMTAKLVRQVFEHGDVGSMVLVSGAGGLQYAVKEIRTMMPIHVAFFRGGVSASLMRESTGHIFFDPLEEFGFGAQGGGKSIVS